MYIESKLKETGKALFCFQLEGDTILKQEIQRKDIEQQIEPWLKAKCKIQYTNGLFVVDTNFQNEKTLTDIFTVKGQYIQVTYLSKGKPKLLVSEDKQSIAKGHVQCFHAKDTVNCIEMPAFEPTHYRGVFLSKDYYLNLLKNESWIKEDKLFEKVCRGGTIKLSCMEFPIYYNLYNILSQITEENWEGNSGKYYLDLRLKELFLSLHLLEQEVKEPKDKEISEENFKKVEEAHAYLVANFRNPPTIKSLSRKILLNELELKKNFKKMYGKTIRSFIIDLRMQKAKSLVGKHAVGEMAEILGYKSVPHFINTFKRYYGYTPKQSLKH